MKGFSPRERNGVIALGCITILCIAAGFLMRPSESGGKSTDSLNSITVDSAISDTTLSDTAVSDTGRSDTGRRGFPMDSVRKSGRKKQNNDTYGKADGNNGNKGVKRAKGEGGRQNPATQSKPSRSLLDDGIKGND